MEKLRLHVSDFIALVNQTLDYAYPVVEVEGEVASFKVNQAKYVFFDLKDESGSVGCFMTVWQLRVPIEDGMKVVVTAQPKLTDWGKFSLTVRAVRPVGEGALKKSFELLKAKLDAEGLFAPERKRLLPSMPSHVAVITSTGAAGYADFVKIIGERWGGMQVDVAHVQVQGEVAPDQMIRALEYFNSREQLPDVIVLIRGGGSADDLAAYNDEQLVRAIAASRVPTLVGVGHETDEHLADLVADVRAATPSNAAQLLVPDKHDVARAVRLQLVGLANVMTRRVDDQRAELRTMLSGAFEAVESSVNNVGQELAGLRQILAQLNPQTVLERGYALVRGKLKVGETIDVETARVIMKAEVRNVQTK